MPAPPLTHHEIMTLIAPFARAGRHVDLAASQRLERKLVFKPPLTPDGTALPADAPRETLQLDCQASADYRLTRTLRRPDGLQADLQADLQARGSDPAALLAAIEAVPREVHFADDGRCRIARSYVLDSVATRGAPPPRLERGSAVVPGLRLELTVPAARGVAADIRLVPEASPAPALPEDFLAVLGWNWARLLTEGALWTSKLRLPRDPVYRTRRAEQALGQAGAHLAQALADAPALFHPRWRLQRRQVFIRRGIPALTALVLLTAVATLALGSPPEAKTAVGMWFALFHLPTALFALSFALQELPRLEIPPWPRPLDARAWRPTAP